MKPAFLAVMLVSLAACGEDPPPEGDATACGALEMGPYVAVTAAVGKDTSTPAILSDAQAYTITLPASGIGYVAFEATSARDHVVFVDRDVPVTAQTSTSMTIAAKSSAKSSDACVTIKGRYVFNLAAGKNYLGVGPDAGGPVNVVID
ncbi:MAG: hypothetical protein JWP01_1804 [Myxococcales bacterium]|nr:hypothetical protein [Myxococcales bacterium]